LEDNWREQVDPDFQALLPDFIANLQSESARLPGLLERAEFGELARIGHNFKGSTGYFGLTELEQLSRTLELQSRAADKPAVSATIDAWQALLVRLGLAPDR